MVPITLTEFIYVAGCMSLEKHVVCRKFVCYFPVSVPKATASPIEMKPTVKASQYLFSPVKVVQYCL